MTYRIDLRETLAAMNTERQRLERLYHNSPRFVEDARQWIADPVSIPMQLADAICAAYRQSTAFRNVIDDAEAGEIRW